jgi:hypothetical protein
MRGEKEMSDIQKAVSDIIDQNRSQLPHSASQITTQVDAGLTAIAPRAAREDWPETQHDSACTSGLSTRTCHRVNNGDGTYSETWCDNWTCV